MSFKYHSTNFEVSTVLPKTSQHARGTGAFLIHPLTKARKYKTEDNIDGYPFSCSAIPSQWMQRTLRTREFFSPRIGYVPLYIFARRYGGLNGSQRGHLSSLLDGFSRETQVVETFPLRPAVFLPGSHLFQQVSSTTAMLLGNFVHDFSRLPLTVRWPCIYITCM